MLGHEQISPDLFRLSLYESVSKPVGMVYQRVKGIEPSFISPPLGNSLGLGKMDVIERPCTSPNVMIYL